MRHTATLRGTATKVVLPSTSEHPHEAAFLLVRIDVDCPECGTYAIDLVGHHLRAIRDLLIEFIDLHPDLVGEEHNIAVKERLQFGGRPDNDPSQN